VGGALFEGSGIGSGTAVGLGSNVGVGVGRIRVGVAVGSSVGNGMKGVGLLSNDPLYCVPSWKGGETRCWINRLDCGYTRNTIPVADTQTRIAKSVPSKVSQIELFVSTILFISYRDGCNNPAKIILNAYTSIILKNL